MDRSFAPSGPPKPKKEQRSWKPKEQNEHKRKNQKIYNKLTIYWMRLMAQPLIMKKKKKRSSIAETRVLRTRKRRPHQMSNLRPKRQRIRIASRLLMTPAMAKKSRIESEVDL